MAKNCTICCLELARVPNEQKCVKRGAFNFNGPSPLDSLVHKI